MNYSQQASAFITDCLDKVQLTKGHQTDNTYNFHTGGVIKKCFFLNPLQPTARLHIDDEPLNASRVCIQSYWLAIFLTTNSSRVLASQRWQNTEHSWKKEHFFLEHDVY